MLLAMSFSFSILAQSDGVIAKASLQLEKKEELNVVINMGSKGFIITSAKGKYEWNQKFVNVSSYRNDLSLRWKLSLPKVAKEILNPCFAASPLSPFVYYLQLSDKLNAKKGIFAITRIDSTGEKVDFNCKIDGELDNYTKIAIFSDANNLYILQQTNLHDYSIFENKNKKNDGTKNKLILYTLKHESEVFEKNIIDLNLFNEAENENWQIEFLGNDNNRIVLGKKKVNLTNRTITYDLISLNSNGSIINTRTIKSEFKNEPVPSLNHREFYGNSVFDNDSKRVSANSGSNQATHTMEPYPGSFGCSLLDLNNEFLYLFGFTAPYEIPDKNRSEIEATKALASGFYVRKYSIKTGNLISEFEEELPAMIKANRKLTDPVNFQERALDFNILDEKKNLVRFICFGGNTAYLITINLDTKTSKTLKKDARNTNSFYLDNYSSLLIDEGDGSEGFVNAIKKCSSFNKKDLEIQGINQGSNTVILKYHTDSDLAHIEMQLFKTSK